jgi:NDP-sugar pyrophosphorylase family protein
MQAVILAAGRGTRMKELTDVTPKSLLLVQGKPVLEHIFGNLPASVDEVVLVVGYLQEQIRAFCGTKFMGKNIQYVEQDTLDGTYGALLRAKPLLKDRFLVMNGDDICLAEDMAACAASEDWAMLVQEVEELGTPSKVVLDEKGNVTAILEKEVHGGGPGLANTANFFLLDIRIFRYEPVLRPGSDTEYGLPQTVVQAAKDIPIHPIHAHAIIRLTSPEDLQKAEEALARKVAQI